MRFYAEKALMQNAVVNVGRAVASKSPNPALEGILVEASADGEVTMTGFDMRMGIRASFPADVYEPGRIVLPSKLFGEIIRRMPDDSISFSEERKMVHLSCGLATFDLTGMDAEEFPSLPDVEGGDALRLNQAKLKSMINQTSFAVSQDEMRPVHTGVLFDLEGGSLTAVATDGFRLAMRKEAVDEDGNLSFVVPGNALNEVERMCRDGEDSVEVRVGTKHILFRFEDSVLITRRLDGQFLDYKKAVPRDQPVVMTVERKILLSSVERASIVLTDKLKSPLRCVMGDDSIDLTTRTTVGVAHDVCYAEGDGGGMEIGFNNRYMMEALRMAPCDKLKLGLRNANSPCVITPADGEEEFTFMVLPVRLKEA